NRDPELKELKAWVEDFGLSIRETADVLGVTEGSAKAQLSRARAKLKLLTSKQLPGQIQTGFQR
ncbi:MAG TPA: sigma-70 region 4 domain-containing protein, partial [Candidatus Acidoferrum sp.]|nr:sigma-70 region 4 domain-containing protein [Candidatus Acidoferrum sp.]